MRIYWKFFFIDTITLFRFIFFLHEFSFRFHFSFKRIIEIATEFNRLIIAKIQINRVLNIEEDRYYMLINIKEGEIDVKEV